MSELPTYPYAAGNLLIDRNTYFYTSYHGAPFLDAWAAQRALVLDMSSATVSEPLPLVTSSDHLMDRIRIGLAIGTAMETKAQVLLLLDRLLQRFEVTKRIYDAYRPDWKAVDPAAFYSFHSYVRFAEILVAAYGATSNLIYLNTLLKCADTLCALSSRLSAPLLARLSAILKAEASFVNTLRACCGPNDRGRANDICLAKAVSNHAPVTLEGVAMIACASARSQAYIQALLKQGLKPERVIFLGQDVNISSTAPAVPETWNGIWLPQLGESVAETCRKADIPLTFTNEPDVNTETIASKIRSSGTKIMIYSGVGGQIVSEQILRIGPRFLHIHSGLLPEYRGSTTIYYSLLNGDTPGCTAIYLDPSIDTGPILERRSYPVPPSGMDVDLVYDPAIRADLLSRIMSRYHKTGCIEEIETQTKEDGRVFYVIHPVLKHIALLSVEIGQ